MYDDFMTDNMFIGMIVWLAVLTFLVLILIVFFIRELMCPPEPEDDNYFSYEHPEEPEMYFPTFFPRVRLDTGSSKPIETEKKTPFNEYSERL